jgi:hypothetical protein
LFGGLARRNDGSLDLQLAKLGLLAPNGPNAVDAPAPSQDAIDLAYWLAGLSLAPLRDAIEAKGGRGFGLGRQWWLDAPATDLLPAQTVYGVPLLAACSPESVPAEHNALSFAACWLAVRALPRFAQVRLDFEARLTRLLAVEHALWQLAAAHGGPSDRIPYALRFRALGWFWAPEAHNPALDGCALCLRCGELIPPAVTGRPRRASPPRCTHCAKDPPSARTWPDHAIAPDGHGTWWLHCQAGSCDGFFVGGRNQFFCEEHDSSRLTASKRESRNP